MYRLEKLEIHGFKSFYDRTQVVFPARTTAVVGPNGCGKSNISDAIHWVLGEQRVRTLRGEKMEDVIFNGSSKRKPLGRAEVSLFLSRNGPPPPEPAAAAVHPPSGDIGLDPSPDPAGDEPAPGGGPEAAGTDAAVPVNGGGDGPGSPARTLPPALRPGAWPENIRITRRLFRDGGSDYLIDGGRCRLRDVRDLLHRLSVGTGASVIIEQGKVEQIVASKPADRRILIEEAAGIAGFKAKKREATLKLEATEANLVRLEDIVGEVRRQINSVKRQAGKARRYARLMEERRRLERISYHHRGRELEDRLVGLRRDRAAIEDEETGLAARLADAESEAERLRAEVDEGDRRLGGLREELHALDLQVDREERGVQGARRGAAELETQAATAEREAEELDGRAGEMEAERAAREADALELGGEVRRLHTTAEALEAEVEAGRSEIEAAEQRLEERRRALFDLADRIADGRGRLERLEEDRRRSGAAAERAERETAEAAAERDRLAGELTRVQGAVGEAEARGAVLGAEREEAGRRAHEGRGRLRGAEDRRRRAQLERSSLQERLEALEDRNREDSPQGRGRRAAGAAGRGVVVDSVRPAPELEESTESYLADLLPAVLLDADGSAPAAAERLREAAGGRASFLVPGLPGPVRAELPPALASDPRVRGRLADLLGAHGEAAEAVRGAADGAVVVDDLPAALDLARRHPGRAFLTLRGEVLRPGGLLTAGREADSSRGILALRRRIAETRARLAEIEAVEAEAAGEVEALGTAIADDERRAETADAERSRLRVSAAELTERRAALAEAHERAGRAHRVRSEEGAGHRADAAARAEEATAVRKELESLEAERTEGEEAIRSAARERDRAREELTRRADQAADLRGSHEGALARLEAAAAEARRLGEGAGELRHRAARDREAAGSRREKAADLHELAARTEISLTANLEGRGALQGRLAGEAEGLEGLRERATARAGEAKEHGAALEVVRGRRMEADVAIGRAESEREFLERACRNDLDRGLAEASASLAPGEAETPRDEVEASLGGVREKIERIGPVNVMAVEEFRQLEERHGFLTGQQQDLLDSVRSLKETISRINRSSRERFQSAFHHIRGNFQETYRLLFGGGRADLHLEEGASDVLESGVEISAQPPGKRLQRIALLSGGEKALTAISLLFAIFRYRPSPFCILDEVDAPLDEANVGRYTEMLRGMAEETQFVVITHNKRTMERADVLYGVTMQEPGVSRLVSVRFESDGRLAAQDGSGEFALDPAPARAASSPTPA